MPLWSMAPSAADKEVLKEKAKAAKKLQSLAQLGAVYNTYKAACRRHGVPMYKPLSHAMEQNIQEKGGKIDKVTLIGPEIGPGSLKAALEMMAGYGSVKNLALYGCSIGDEGLLAVAQLVRASTYKYWTGAKLRLLEIVSDGAGCPLDTWPERYLRHLNGGLAVSGKAHAMPSLSLENDAQSVTAETLHLTQAKHAPPSHTELEAELAQLSRTSGTVTSLTFQLAEEVRELEAQSSAALRASGYLPSSIIEGTQLPKTTFQLDPTIAAAAAAADNPFSSTAPIQTIAEEAEDEEISEQASTSDQFKKSPPGSRPASALGHAVRPSALGITANTLSKGQSGTLQSHSRQTRSSSSSVGASGQQRLPAQDTRPELLATPTADELAARSARQTPKLPLSSHPLDPPRPMTFSPGAFRALSLGLAAQGGLLQILVLDHNQLGDLGAQILSTGIRRCGTLQQLSLEDCGIGPEGALALGGTMVPHDDPKIYVTQPKYLALNLSRNPLGSQGVINLSKGIACCPTLKVKLAWGPNFVGEACMGCCRLSLHGVVL
ncbi:hypothetical protein DUNSADRAFT_10869 [Dunaliella salina]|uniref:Uncharacterized protein n=1 Tax=Dunaliella salina TaxID=3046 RepID=A0ABQ7HA13_DUNSA|nr:hypothetical protein DUNSADRAFT_10869 [Dunaliella salina]|eukprot:KAF5843694.1 hypothetical protein DUNSADRAFT_10869 [Dunaliella salina]